MPHGFSVVGYMKEAVESNTCPHFVTGSAMSILAREILGRGALFGRKVDDPILVEFLKVWGRIDVERQNPNRVRSELDDTYRKLERRAQRVPDEYKGYLAEIFMAQVLLSNQNRAKQPLPGRFFNSATDIELPPLLHYLNHRVRLGAGVHQEIDILAAFSGVTWVCQSKWLTAQKTSLAVVQELLEQARVVHTERQPISLRLWLFAHEGLTPDAEDLARQEGILWSNRELLIFRPTILWV